MGTQGSQECKSDQISLDMLSTSTSTCKKDIPSTPLPAIEEHSILQPRASTTTMTRLSSHLAPQISIPDLDTPDSCHELTVTPFPTLTRFNSSNPMKPQLRQNTQSSRSSFANVSNGITGTHISSRISKIAAKFWYKNMERLDMQQQLEIGCSILFGAFSTDTEIKDVLTRNCSQKDKSIAKKALKYLDMIAWLLRNLLRDDIDLYALLTNLGTFHQNMGVKMQHLDRMLQSMHETFSYYFPQQYNVAVKYAMDEIFSIAAQIMTGQDLSYSAYMNNISKAFLNTSDDINFLQNITVCLQSEIGKEYFYQYLKQTCCDEIILFLKMICEFKSQSTAIQRFIIARDIIRISIDPDAHFSVNISYDVRNNTLKVMEKFEMQYRAKQQINIDSDFFVDVEHEIYRLISTYHWSIFKHSMKDLQSKSFGL